ncbi:MAG: hypothetical protein M3134_02875 [Actinomycetota bacterium]|nr:hypothetical protein [Actinomycetota bacterium]
MKRTRLAALLSTLVLAAGCSSPQGTEQPENSLLGKDKRGGNAAGGAQKDGGGKPGGAKNGGGAPGGAPAAPGGGIAIPSPGAADKGGGLDGSSKTETEVESTGEDPRTASVVVTEPDADADKSGVAPEFADILSTRVEGDGPNLRVTITFRGQLPQKMPDEQTYMVAGFGLTGPKGQSQGYAFGASADAKGWTAYGGGKDDKEFPGEFSVSGDTVVFVIPWSAVEGPRPFDWYAQASWFRSLAGTTHYSLDAVPNDGPAKYPAG